MSNNNQYQQDPILQQAQYHIGEADPFIQNVKMEYMNSCTNPIVLDQFSRDLQFTTNFSQLYKNLILFHQNLDETKMFKSVDVKILPDYDIQNGIKINVDIKDRSPYFASIFHGYDEGALMTIKGGYRNLLGLCDVTQLEYNKSLNQNTKKNSFNINQQLPVFINGSKTQYGYIYGQRQVDQGIEELHSTQYIRLQKNNTVLSFENSTRTNQFDMQQVKNFDQDLDTTLKFSTKLNLQPLNTIRKNRRYKGQQIDITSEIALPFSQTKFFKIDMKTRFFNQFDSIKKISNRLHKNTNFEHNFQFGLILPFFNSKLVLNDKFFQNNARGFTQLQSNTFGNQLSMRWSSKWLFYDYPYISEQSKMVIPFWFANMQYNNDLKNMKIKSKEGLRGCVGLGFGVELGLGVRLELLYNMFHQSQQGDVKNNLQIRFSIDD